MRYIRGYKKLSGFRHNVSLSSLIGAIAIITGPALALDDGWYKATSSLGSCPEMATRGVSIAIEGGKPISMTFVHVNLTFLEPEKLDKKARTLDLQEGTGERRQAILKAKSNTAFSMSIIQSPINGRCGGTDLIFELN